MHGWIIDATADDATAAIIIWVKTARGIIRKYVKRYQPSFYVSASDTRHLTDFQDRYEQFPGVISVSFDNRMLQPGGPPRIVLKVTMKTYSMVNQLIDHVRHSDHRWTYAFFDVDIDPVLSFFVTRQVFPMARIDADTLALWDHQYALYYQTPPLTSTVIAITMQNHQIQEIQIDDTQYTGTESAMITALMDHIHQEDPDIIFTDHGDQILPVVYQKSREHNLAFTLGREPEPWSFSQERTYTSYGRIIYSPPKCLLNGRVHIDCAHSFFYRESGLEGLIDIARLSLIPVQKLSRLTPGTAITSMQIAQALRQHVGVPWKKNIPENIKSARALFRADRGGMIYDPVVGLHEQVYELDFSSMYPFIMMNHNISPETVLCDCCPDSTHRVPMLDYNLCERHQGLIPTVLEPLVTRRHALKQRLKTVDSDAYKRRKNALKWVLVTCFGYTGYRNARFGRIECHEAINAFARMHMVEAARIAEHHGFRILHGIIDSLWVHGDGDIIKVCYDIETRTGIPIENEGCYRWIVFLPTKGTHAGSLNHYYGLFDTGTMKVRGLELRRHDTPPVVKHCQAEMLDCLATAHTRVDFMAAIPKVLTILRQHIDMVQQGECAAEQLLFTKTVTQHVDEYHQMNAIAAALTQLQIMNVEIPPGQRIQYLLKDNNSPKYYRKVSTPQTLQPHRPIRYDKDTYTTHLVRSAESILSPFGYTEKRIRAFLNGITTLPINEDTV